MWQASEWLIIMQRDNEINAAGKADCSFQTTIEHWFMMLAGNAAWQQVRVKDYYFLCRGPCIGEQNTPNYRDLEADMFHQTFSK